MFYEFQLQEKRFEYKQMLSLIGSMSNLFSESEEPMLNYRAHENVFCKYFDAVNLAREDCSADAKKDGVGIGLKTWVGRNDQKVAEFGKLKEEYAGLTGEMLVKKIASYRNSRIRTTMNLHNLSSMVYHVIKRVPYAMEIYECNFDYIDIENIVVDYMRGNENNTYFSDGKHTYHFSSSKNTLYMLFDDMKLVDKFDVYIENNPYEVLKQLLAKQDVIKEYSETNPLKIEKKDQLCLRLYAKKSDGSKYVPERSGLNQWNAQGRPRDVNEIYIPYLAEDRLRIPNFFPPRDTQFKLNLPDGNIISAKVCQRAYRKIPDSEYRLLTIEEKMVEDEKSKIGKSIMSNPNKDLGKWLLRDVFELPDRTIVTYEMLCEFGIDSVIFTKNSDLEYSIDFCSIGTYDEFYRVRQE